VLVHDVKITYNQNTVSMRSADAMVGVPQVGRATMELDFRVTLREDRLVNEFIDYVRKFGSEQVGQDALGLDLQQELQNSRALLLQMTATEAELRDQLLRLSNQIGEMRKMTDSYKAKNTAMERELVLLSCLVSPDTAATERVAEAAVRGWVISLQEEGEFGREEILDLVKRIALLINRAEAAKARFSETSFQVVETNPKELSEVTKDPQLF
jgi:hypothetical protein